MSIFYLDANIFICLASKKVDSRKNDLINGLSILSQIEGSSLVTSEFAFVEVAKALTHTHKEEPKAVAKKINKITKQKKVESFEFSIVPTSPDPSYTFNDFWVAVGENMNLYNPGWGDSIHCVIMRNNKICHIVSLDEKDDFEIVPGLTLVHPLNSELVSP